jgi:hypothetical protein
MASGGPALEPLVDREYPQIDQPLISSLLDLLLSDALLLLLLLLLRPAFEYLIFDKLMNITYCHPSFKD